MAISPLSNGMPTQTFRLSGMTTMRNSDFYQCRCSDCSMDDMEAIRGTRVLARSGNIRQSKLACPATFDHPKRVGTVMPGRRNAP